MTRLPAKPYYIAEIAYNPAWPDMPWHVHRTGVIPEQGGLCFGNQTVSFDTLENALEYLKETIEKDMPEYERLIKEREAVKP